MISPLLPTYSRLPISFMRGDGVYLYDQNDKKYLDLYSGIGVNCLGHKHPALVSALKDQADKVWHVSNLFEIPGQTKLAECLVANSFADTVFFTNSGAESIELCIKMVRKHFHNKGESKHRIITMSNAFHGRTLAGIASSGQEKLTAGFEPLPDGFDVVPFADIAAVKTAITPQTAAIMVEPVQGEGGIRPLSTEDMKSLRAIANEHGLLLVFDEIQCGMGRTGKLFAHEWAGITPDILASAKGIGGGFPVGAVLATEHAASGMTAGTHGTTYGGNPLAMAVSNAVMDVLLSDGFLDGVQTSSALLFKALNNLAARFPKLINVVRGQGLMIGIQCPDIEPRRAMAALLDYGLVVAPAGDNIIRLLPPLILNEKNIEEAVLALSSAFIDWSENGPPK